MKFTEAKLEQAIIALLSEQGFPHVSGTTLSGSNGAPAPLNESLSHSNKDAAGATSLPEDHTQRMLDTHLSACLNFQN
ncbi:MAG: hypothetical protein QMB90_09055, partial [Rubritalea sp.]